MSVYVCVCVSVCVCNIHVSLYITLILGMSIDNWEVKGYKKFKGDFL